MLLVSQSYYANTMTLTEHTKHLASSPKWGCCHISQSTRHRSHNSGHPSLGCFFSSFFFFKSVGLDSDPSLTRGRTSTCGGIATPRGYWQNNNHDHTKNGHGDTFKVTQVRKSRIRKRGSTIAHLIEIRGGRRGCQSAAPS